MDPKQQFETKQPIDIGKLTEAEKQAYIEGVICAQSLPGQSIDFRNNLVLAKPQDYAMVHGCGGQDHAANSTIILHLCDGVTEDGRIGTEVSFHCDVGFIEYWMLGVKHIAAEGPNNWEQLNALGFYQNANQLRKSLARHKSEMQPEAYQAISDLSDQMASAAQQLARCRWTQEKEKVGRRRRQKDGYVPYSQIQVWYQSFFQEQPTSAPWHIRVVNGFVPFQKKQQYYRPDPAQIRDQTEVTVHLTSVDLYMLLTRVKSFLRIWEIRLGGDLVLEGLETREQILSRRRSEKQARNRKQPSHSS